MRGATFEGEVDEAVDLLATKALVLEPLQVHHLHTHTSQSHPSHPMSAIAGIGLALADDVFAP